MSSGLSLLSSDLQSLAAETRRRHADVREAAENALKVLANPGEVQGANDVLLKPVILGCQTRNNKVIGMSLALLQRIISQRNTRTTDIPLGTFPSLLNILTSYCIPAGVDIQLRVLQTLLSLVTNYREIHGELLGEALLVCFRLYESKIAVVRSTAAATLRQLVMFVVEKIVLSEAKEDSSIDGDKSDALAILSDLCLLANSNNDRPALLHLDSLPKTFALELIESVLTNYHALFLRQIELMGVIREHLCPLLLKVLSAPGESNFALRLRCTRVVWLLVNKLFFKATEGDAEGEVFLMLLVKDVEYRDGKDVWMRVLALEIIRGLCADPNLILTLFHRYDTIEESSNVVSSIIGALHTVITTGSVRNLSEQSGMKVQCIDQLDKTDSPPIPDGYPSLLAIQALVAFCDALSNSKQDFENVKAVLATPDIPSTFLESFISLLKHSSLSQGLFTEVLGSYQSMLNLTGALLLPDVRDTFLTNLEDLIVTGTAATSSLSDRQLACLRVLVTSVLYLSNQGEGLMEGSWRGVLSALRDAYTATSGPTTHSMAIASSSSSSIGTISAPESEVEILITRTMDATKQLEDGAFGEFIRALCSLPSTNYASFVLTHLLMVSVHNIHRMIYRTPDIAWNDITSYLLSIIHPPATSPTTATYAPSRIHAARVLDEILLGVMRNRDMPIGVQTRAVQVLGQQVVGVFDLEIRKMGLETLLEILQVSGHNIIGEVEAWEVVFDIIGFALPNPTASSVPSSPRPMTPATPVSTLHAEAVLLKLAFASLTLITDSLLTLLSAGNLKKCINVIGGFGRVADVNTALTAAGSLMWAVSDGIKGRKTENDTADIVEDLWMTLLMEVQALCLSLEGNTASQVRDGAIQTLFRTIGLYGGTWSSATWERVIWGVVLPLVGGLLGQNVSIEEDFPTTDFGVGSGSKILALLSLQSMLGEFMRSKIMGLENFEERFWTAFIALSEGVIAHDSHEQGVVEAALRCLEGAVNAYVNSDGTSEIVFGKTWGSLMAMGKSMIAAGGFTQESLLAYVDLIGSVFKIKFDMTDGKGETLLKILKGVITYQKSPEYRMDIDGLTPVQSAILKTITRISSTRTDGIPSLIVRDLAEYATLAYNNPFDYVPQSTFAHMPATPPSSFITSPSVATVAPIKKRITYIALSKATMPMLAELFISYSNFSDVIVDGTTELVLGAYGIPIRLAGECPPSSSKWKADFERTKKGGGSGGDDPLWKIATKWFLEVVKVVVNAVGESGSLELSSERVEGIWTGIIDGYAGGLLAPCPDEDLGQESYTVYYITLLQSLKDDVIPHLYEECIPDDVVRTIGAILSKGSTIHSDAFWEEDEGYSSRRTSEDAKAKTMEEELHAYWCFEMLFEICRFVEEPLSKRLGLLSLPALLARCKSVLVRYVRDESIRGGIVPFGRSRETEVLWVLRRLNLLMVWPGAFYDDEEKNAIAIAVKASSRAHLFYFYELLCNIISMRKGVEGYVPIELLSPPKRTGLKEGAIHLDARGLAKESLKEIAVDMGLGLGGWGAGI